MFGENKNTSCKFYQNNIKYKYKLIIYYKGMMKLKGTKKRQVYNPQKIEELRDVMKHVQEKYPNNVAFKYKKDSEAKQPEYIEKTYSQYVKDIKAFATSLLELGYANKKIAVIGKNRYEWCITYMAATTGGMIIVPLDKALPDNEIETLVRRSGAEIVIFDKKYSDIMLKIKEDKQNKVNMLVDMDNEKIEGIEKFENLLENGYDLLEKGNKKYDEVKTDVNKMSILLFTSGTTSEPKGVMLSQKNICSDLSSITSWVKIYPKDTLLSFLPIHHTFECMITFLYGTYSGATIAFCDGLKYIQKNMQEYKVTILVAVPLVLETMYKKIQKGIKDQGKEKLIKTVSKISNGLLKCHIDFRKVFFKQILDNFGGKLRVVLYGAAPMNKETIVGFNNLGISLIQGYGLTEASPVIAAETDKEKRPGSVGLIFDTIELKIDNPNEEGIGEILVKGPNITSGYYENEEATKKAFTKEGWFKTGDYGYLDKDEFLYVTGRKNDIIVLRNGKNVYPQEIEFLINKLPYVKESLVYQREQSKTDTMLCAKIVYDVDLIKKELGSGTKEEYQEKIWEEIKKINEQVPNFKHIKQIEITTQEFAKTTTQKVKRYKELEKIQ